MKCIYLELIWSPVCWLWSVPGTSCNDRGRWGWRWDVRHYSRGNRKQPLFTIHHPSVIYQKKVFWVTTIFSQVTGLIWSQDLRVQEVKRLLQSSRPVRVSVVQLPEVSDHEYIEEKENKWVWCPLNFFFLSQLCLSRALVLSLTLS